MSSPGSTAARAHGRNLDAKSTSSATINPFGGQNDARPLDALTSPYPKRASPTYPASAPTKTNGPPIRRTARRFSVPEAIRTTPASSAPPHEGLSAPTTDTHVSDGDGRMVSLRKRSRTVDESSPNGQERASRQPSHPQLVWTNLERRARLLANACFPIQKQQCAHRVTRCQRLSESLIPV